MLRVRVVSCFSARGAEGWYTLLLLISTLCSNNCLRGGGVGGREALEKIHTPGIQPLISKGWMNFKVTDWCSLLPIYGI